MLHYASNTFAHCNIHDDESALSAQDEIELEQRAGLTHAECQAPEQSSRGPVVPLRGGRETGDAVGAGEVHDARGERRSNAAALEVVGHDDSDLGTTGSVPSRVAAHG